MSPNEIILNNIKDLVGEEYISLPYQVNAVNKIIEALSTGKRWIWISGSIGSGKSTLAEAYAKALKSCKHIKAINIREYSDLITIKNARNILIDDIGKNPIKINHMGDYIEVVPFIMYNRIVPYVTIFTANNRADERIFMGQKAIEDRFRKYGVEINLIGKSLR